MGDLQITADGSEDTELPVMDSVLLTHFGPVPGGKIWQWPLETSTVPWSFSYRDGEPLLLTGNPGGLPAGGSISS